MSGLLVLAIALATFAADAGYRWCVPMQRAMSTCCCPHSAATEFTRLAADQGLSEEQPPQLLRISCCELRDGAGAPAVGTPATPEVRGAPPTAALPLPASVVLPARRHGGTHRSPMRTLRSGCTFSRGSPEACAVLRVYRC